MFSEGKSLSLLIAVASSSVLPVSLTDTFLRFLDAASALWKYNQTEGQAKFGPKFTSIGTSNDYDAAGLYTLSCTTLSLVHSPLLLYWKSL